jgi:predicted CoA-binding protein
LSQSEIRNILRKAKTIAVVGSFKDPRKDSHRVSVYLQQIGYRIVPVNPFAEQVLGEESYVSS